MNRILSQTVATLLLSTAAASAQLSWGTGGAGGSGTWDTTTANWFDGTSNVTWDSNIAIFGGTAGTVTISGSTNIQASQIIFNTPGYVIAGSSDLVSPTDGTFNVTTNADATISATIEPVSFGTGLAAFVKDGAGTLTLSGSVAGYRQVQINNGNLDLEGLTYYGFAQVPVTIANVSSAALTITGSTEIGALNGGGTLGGVVQPESASGGATLVFASNASGVGTGSFAGSLRDNGSSLLSIDAESNAIQALTGTNTYSGSTKVTQGTLTFAGQGAALNTSDITISHSGVLVLDNSGTNSPNRLSDTATITNLGSLVLVGNGSAPTSETLGSLHASNGATSSVTVVPDPAQPGSLTFASIVTSPGAVAIFRGANLGAAPAPGVANILATTAPTLVGGGGLAGSKTVSIVPYALGDFSATGSGSTFVTYDANGIRPLSDSEYANNDFTIAGANVNVDSATAVSTTASINALRLKNGANISGSGTISVGSGTLVQLPGVGNISATTLDFGASALLDIQGTTTISSAITAANGSRGLSKLGAGKLTLTGANTYGGSTLIAEGTLNIQNSSALGSGGSTVNVDYGAVLEVQGGIHVSNETIILSGYGQGSPIGSTGAFRSISGNNSWDGPFLFGGAPVIGVDSGSLTITGSASTFTGFTKVGNGSLIFPNAIGTGGGAPIYVSAGWLISTVTSGAPIGQTINLTNGGLEVAPSGSGGAISLSQTLATNYYGGSSIEVSKGANVSVSYRLPLNRAATGATLVVIPGSGLAALGVSEKLISSTTATNGIVSASMVGQDNDANLSGTFLGYNLSNGLVPGNYSANTDLNTSGASTVFQANTNQTLTANRNVFALQDNGHIIDLGSKALLLGSIGSTGGIILNGGVIQNGTLTISASDAAIYTSLAGGKIATPILTPFGGGIAFFGPGKVTLSSANTYSATTYVNGGNLNLQGSLASPVSVAPGAMLSGTGRTSQIVSGGTISPGNGGPGILTASAAANQQLLSNPFTAPAFTKFAFEFTKTGLPDFGSATASGNDILHLTSTSAAFSNGALSVSNEIDLYFNVSFGLQMGQTYVGGFFTDKNSAFDGSISQANYKVFASDPLGTTTFDGVTYSSVDTGEIAVSTVPETVDFGSGPINGYAMQVQIVPEPGVLSALLGGIAVLGFRRRRRA